MGSIVQKGLRLCSGQTHVKRYLEPLTKLIQEKKVDTTFLITHRSTDLTAPISIRPSRRRRTAA
jgi:threonine dehydrogenase-like Zn-dependent dehydrogenase